MGFFGFKSSKEVEEEKRQAAEEAARRVEQNNLTNLSNLSKGSQLNFAIPYFDVFDPRLQDYGVPVSVHGAVVYAIEDMDLFHSVNRNEGYSDETFKNKLRGQLTKFIKSVVSNAPSDAQIPVVQIERKIFEISELIQQRVTPQVEKLFGITIRSLDITGINVDKESRGYRELKALTADLEKERMMAQHNAQISNFNLNNDLQQDMLKKQSELNLDAMGRKQELDLGGQEELQRMNLENQRETMRIQREEMQRASRLQTEQTFMGAHQANLNAGVLNNATDNGINAFRQQTMGGMNNMVRWVELLRCQVRKAWVVHLRCQAWVLQFLRYSIILASMVSSMVHAIGTSSSSSFSRVSSPSSHTFGRTVWRSGSLPVM